MNHDAKAIVWGVATGALKTLRFLLYVVLCVAGGVIQPAANFLIGCGMFVFLFCLFLLPALTGPMWGGLAVAVGVGVFLAFYGAALRWAAPEGVVIITDM